MTRREEEPAGAGRQAVTPTPGEAVVDAATTSPGHPCMPPFLLPKRIAGLPYIEAGAGGGASSTLPSAALPRHLLVHRSSASACSTASCLSRRTDGSSGFRRMISS